MNFCATSFLYRYYNESKCRSIDTLVLVQSVGLSMVENLEENGRADLKQAQLAGAGNGLCAPLDLQLVEDPAVVSFNRIQGQEKPFADLVV